jgi:hypothetical protein
MDPAIRNRSVKPRSSLSIHKKLRIHSNSITPVANHVNEAHRLLGTHHPLAPPERKKQVHNQNVFSFINNKESSR